MIKIKQLLIAILVIFCLAIFCFCLNYYREFRKFAIENVVKELACESTYINYQLRNFLKVATENVAYMARTDIIIDESEKFSLKSKKSPSKKDKVSDTGSADVKQANKKPRKDVKIHEETKVVPDADHAQRILKYIKEKNPIISDVYLVDPSGKMISASPDYNKDFVDTDDRNFFYLSNLYHSIATGLSGSYEDARGASDFYIKAEEGDRKTFFAVYAHPVLKKNQPAAKENLIGFITVVVPVDGIASYISTEDSNTIVRVSHRKESVQDFYVVLSKTVVFARPDDKRNIILYVDTLKPIENVESNILESILSQVKTNIFISIAIGFILIGCFSVITHSFGTLGDFIHDIRNKSVVGKERFLIYEFNETSKQLMRMKQEIDFQVFKVNETNQQLKISNDEKEVANEQLKNVNSRLEVQVEERTESLRKSLELSRRCNEINSTIISQRGLIKEDFSSKQVFNAFISTINQFNLKKKFLFEYKIENEKKLRYSDIEADVPEIDENFHSDAYINRDGFYIFPLVMHEGVGRLVIHSPIESIDPAILSNISIFCRDASIFLDNRVLRNRLAYWAKTDGLTKLGNRAAYEQAISFYETSLDREIGLFLIDVNGLKEMNDKQGHAAGDTLLVTVSERLKKVFSKYDAQLYRIGGDEFIAILQQEDLDNADRIIEELLAAQDDPFNPQFRSGIVATFAIGFADSRKVPFEVLYKHADVEMYARKEAYYKKRQEFFGEHRKPRH